MAAHPEWGTVDGDRVALRDRLRDAPLGAALQGALLLGFAAALVFALIAFVVNATVSADTAAAIMPLLRAVVRSEGVTVLVATHDQALLGVADRVLSLSDGVITEEPAPVP